MKDDAGTAFSTRFSPKLTPWLAFGWTAAVAFVWLFRYEACLLPVQLWQLASTSLSALHPQFRLAPLVDAGCAAVILAAAFGVGAVIVARVTEERSLLAGLFALAVGLWIEAVAVLVVGVFSVARIAWTLGLLAAWLLPAPREFFRRSRGERRDNWTKLMIAMVIVAALLNLVGALSPPFEYDELEYHLGGPSEYVKAGRIVALPHNFYSDLPQLTEMLYLLAMQIASDIAAKLLHWSFGILSALTVYAVAARLWSRRVALTGAAMFYCLPFVQDLSQTARIDLATTFYGTLAFGAVLLDWWPLAAAATGCAVATKWPAVAVVLLPAFVGVVLATKSLRRVAVFALLSSVFVLPWLIKNWCFTGNPIYPLLERSELWTAAQAAMFASRHSPHFDANGLGQFFERASHYSFVEPGAIPVLLMTAPLLFLVRNAGQSARRAVWLLVVAYVGWYALTFRPWRFLFPAIPFAAMIGAVALDRAGKWCQMVVAATMVVGLMGMGLNVLIDVENPRQVPAQISLLTYAVGQDSRAEFITRIGLGMFEPIVWMNRNFPDSAKVLYIGEARTHYARHPVVWATAFDQHPVMHGVAGVTHVYINFPEWERLRTHYDYLLDFDAQAFRRFLEEHGRVVHENGRSKVYELNP